MTISFLVNGINYESNISSLQIALDKKYKLKNFLWKNNINHSTKIKDVNLIGYDLLKHNPTSFVNNGLSLRFNDSSPNNLKNKNFSELTVFGV